MGDFEVDTRVEGADGKYRGAISGEWRAWGPAGGYVAAIALRAASMEARIMLDTEGRLLAAARATWVRVEAF